MPYLVIPSAGVGSVVVVASVVVIASVVVGWVDVAGAMVVVVAGIVGGVEVLVGGTSVVVLAWRGWGVVLLAALSEISGAHATAITVNAIDRARQGCGVERSTVLEVIALG
jgi:hypothetical protein